MTEPIWLIGVMGGVFGFMVGMFAGIALVTRTKGGKC
jgi:hypothetical protein